MILRESVLRYLFSRWGFLLPPELPSDREMIVAFEQLWHSLGAGEVIHYDLPYEKTQFTRWLVAEKGVLLHGSNHGRIEELTPRKQTNFSGKQVEAVFASSDGLWPVYFAVLDYQNPALRSTRNGCFSIGDKRYYLFCVKQETSQNPLWTTGWVYILPPDGFVSQDPKGMWQCEWICPNPVTPLARLAVSYVDFPFRQHVVGFRRGESMLKTWNQYGRRTMSKKAIS